MTDFAIAGSRNNFGISPALRYGTDSPSETFHPSGQSQKPRLARTGHATSYSTDSIDRDLGTASIEVGIDMELAALQLSAEREDTAAFVQAYRQMDWTNRQAEDFVYVATLAVLAGANLTARKLTEEGATRFPMDGQLSRFASALAPPKIIATRPVPARVAADRLANLEWLRDKSAKYSGKWVALRAGELVAQGNSARDLAGLLGEVARQFVLFAQIP